MTEPCQRVVEQLGMELDPELSAHVRSCERCRSVLSSYDAVSNSQRFHLADESSSEIKARALSELASHPRVRPWWWEGAIASILNLVIAVVGLLALSEAGLVRNAAPMPIVVAIGTILVCVVLAGPMIALAPGRRLARSALISTLPLLALAIGLGGSGFDPGTELLRLGMPCLRLEIALSVLPIALALWVLTSSAFQPRRAALAGMSGGAVGLLVLHLHCPIGTASHLFLFHVLPWIALTGAVIAVRSRIPSRSFAP